MALPSEPHTTSQNRVGPLRRLRDTLFPQSEELIRLAGYVILFVLLITFVLDRPQSISQTRFYGTILTLTGLLLLNLLWSRMTAVFPERAQGELFGLILSAVLTLAAVYLGFLYNALYLVFMLAAQSSLILPGLRQALVFIAVVVLGYEAMLALNGASIESLISVGISTLIGLVFTLTLSQVLLRYAEQTRRAEDLLRQLQAANAELLAARQREKDLAVVEERVNLAREIHDGLGHHLTVLSIQLQAAEKFLRSSPDMAEEAVRASRQEAQAALKEVRQSVAALRQPPVDPGALPEAIAAMVKDFDQRSGLRAHLDVQGRAGVISPAAAQTLYRAAQEALTNAQKHAREASSVEVVLDLSSSGMQLTVQDDGKPFVQAVDGSGFGLAGIRERISQLGGKIETGPGPQGGFRLDLWIPNAEQKP